MARRPVFLPAYAVGDRVQVKSIEFEWVAGLARSQKQKCIDSLHAQVRKQASVSRVLEISSKSRDPLGVALSAFNLSFPLDGRQVCVEVAFQSSKRYVAGGPFTDLLSRTAREAKTDPRLKESGRLLEFVWKGESWGLKPATAFYDWLYINALTANRDLLTELLTFEAFTDIEFNPERSLNCQAASAALFVALSKRGELESALASRETFVAQVKMAAASSPRIQGSLI